MACFLLLADIAQRYRISKYPTLKLFRNGMMMKREYRGQRSVTAIADFIRQQKVDPITEIHSLEEVNKVDVSTHTRLHSHTYCICIVSCIVQDGTFLHTRPLLFFLFLSFSLFPSLFQRTKRTIIGYFEQKNSENYHTYERVANILRDDCVFLAAFE